jgi:hypothetical protein
MPDLRRCTSDGRHDAVGGSADWHAGEGTTPHPLEARIAGKVGTIAKKWGEPDQVALEVLLDDGRSRLFWHHELEEIDA